MMKRCLRMAGSLVLGFLLLAIIIGGTHTLAGQVKESELVLQSQILGRMLKSEPTEPLAMLETQQQRTLLRDFIGAVADAYVNFELIPFNEAGAFLAISQSVNEQVEVSGFSYHRRDLVITGTATEEGYYKFVQALEDTGYFDTIYQELVEQNTTGTLEFIVQCRMERPNTTQPFGAFIVKRSETA